MLIHPASGTWDDAFAEGLEQTAIIFTLAPCAARINVNDQIMELYLDHLLPEITQPGDDANYGSSAMHDVTALQASARA